MTFAVEVVLKGRDFAVTDSVVVLGEPVAWTDESVREALVGILRAIAKADDPKSPADREVVLQGFSWIVEPHEQQAVIAIEIPMGAAVAGPFAMTPAELDARISRVMRAERQRLSPDTVH